MLLGFVGWRGRPLSGRPGCRRPARRCPRCRAGPPADPLSAHRRDAGPHHCGQAGRPPAQHAHHGVHAACQAAPHRAGDAAGARLWVLWVALPVRRCSAACCQGCASAAASTSPPAPRRQVFAPPGAASPPTRPPHCPPCPPGVCAAGAPAGAVQHQGGARRAELQVSASAGLVVDGRRVWWVPPGLHSMKENKEGLKVPSFSERLLLPAACCLLWCGCRPPAAPRPAAERCASTARRRSRAHAAARPWRRYAPSAQHHPCTPDSLPNPAIHSCPLHCSCPRRYALPAQYDQVRRAMAKLWDAQVSRGTVCSAAGFLSHVVSRRQPAGLHGAGQPAAPSAPPGHPPALPLSPSHRCLAGAGGGGGAAPAGGAAAGGPVPAGARGRRARGGLAQGAVQVRSLLGCCLGLGEGCMVVGWGPRARRCSGAVAAPMLPW